MDCEVKSMDYETKSMDCEAKSMDYEAKSMDYEAKSMDCEVKSMDYKTKCMDYTAKSMDFGARGPAAKTTEFPGFWPGAALNYLSWDSSGLSFTVMVRVTPPEIYIRPHSGQTDVERVTVWLTTLRPSRCAFACSWETCSCSWDMTPAAACPGPRCAGAWKLTDGSFDWSTYLRFLHVWHSLGAWTAPSSREPPVSAPPRAYAALACGEISTITPGPFTPPPAYSGAASAAWRSGPAA